MLTIEPAITKEQLNTVRTLFREYAEWMGYRLCFESFEKELAGLPGEYAPPRGELFLAFENDEPVGCVALRPVSDDIAEFKRLWVRKIFRGKKIGLGLTQAVIQAAREKGYRKLTLETTPIMEKAAPLYLSLGFRQMRTAGEGDEKIIYMEMGL